MLSSKPTSVPAPSPQAIMQVAAVRTEHHHHHMPAEIATLLNSVTRTSDTINRYLPTICGLVGAVLMISFIYLAAITKPLVAKYL